MIGIGALAKATGIPPETIRTWERRYGFPVPERKPSGHRLYGRQVVDHLKWIRRALDAGHRPAQLLRLQLGEVQAIVASGSAARGGAAQSGVDHGQILAAIEDLNAGRVEQLLRRAWYDAGALRFAAEIISPLLVEIGERWSKGSLGIAVEHFATERLREFLVSVWRPLSEGNSGPNVVAATLAGEQHGLGLHLTALVAAIAGRRLIFIGVDTPSPDIAEIACSTKADAVLVSTSSASDRARTAASLRELRGLLPPTIQVLSGGQGAAPVEGVRTVSSFQRLLDTLKS